MKMTHAAVAALVLGLVTGCGHLNVSLPGAKPKPSVLQAAYTKCVPDYPPSRKLSLADNDHSFIVNSVKASDPDFGRMVCMLVKLHTSTALISEMDHTSAMMGRQTASEGGLHYEWTYYADDGFSMTIRDN